MERIDFGGYDKRDEEKDILSNYDIEFLMLLESVFYELGIQNGEETRNLLDENYKGDEEVRKIAEEIYNRAILPNLYVFKESPQNINKILNELTEDKNERLPILSKLFRKNT